MRPSIFFVFPLLFRRFVFKSLTIILLLAFSSCQTTEKSESSIDLSGSWQFQKQGDIAWLKAEVPGTVQTDLFANKMIPDLFFSDNELKNKWVENENWVYQKTFSIDKLQLKQNADLIFEGLDTYATVFLNGQKILVSDNMFRSYKVDIGSILKAGENILEILFESPVQKAIPLYDSLSYRLPADNDRNEKQTSVFTRKAAYQYGWDWGPRYVTIGIWRSVSLNFWSDFKVLENRLHQIYLSDTVAIIAWNAQIFSETETELNCTINLEKEEKINRKFKLLKGVNQLTDTFRVKNPKRWWPNGYGEPNLYAFNISMRTKNSQFDENKKLGFRTVELITEADSIGESFYFKVNGIPVYAKGANYIPQDNFLPDVDSSRYAQLIKNVKNAHMNMLRVWGGGIYENDIFYDLCDENGIMVWQDFMFACSLYPGDSAFLQNVEQEARDNIKRLRDHPSLALWCGNNEINELWYNWGYQKKFGYSEKDSLKIWSDYQALFNRLLPDLVSELNPKISYWESSPKIGWGHSESMTEGDSHYWGIWWGKEPFEVYEEKVPRFSTEFGFQSLPQMSTLLAFADSNLMNLESEAMQAHQKSSIGNKTIVEYMERDFPVPQNFEDFVYVSQLLQAYGVGKALEAQRRAKPYCMGTLYWQLNDTWPGISWSSLDYFGNWKALHYEAQHDFKTFLISFEEQSDNLSVFVVSDSLNMVDAELELSLMDFYGNIIYAETLDLKIQSNSSKVVFQIPSDLLKVVLDKKKMLLTARLYANSKLLAENNYYFARPKELLLPENSEIEYLIDGNQIQLWSKSNTLIKNVFLETETPVHFSKNYFDILPSDTLCLHFDSDIKLPLKLKFRSLNSIER